MLSLLQCTEKEIIRYFLVTCNITFTPNSHYLTDLYFFSCPSSNQEHGKPQRRKMHQIQRQGFKSVPQSIGNSIVTSEQLPLHIRGAPLSFSLRGPQKTKMYHEITTISVSFSHKLHWQLQTQTNQKENVQIYLITNQTQNNSN